MTNSKIGIDGQSQLYQNQNGEFLPAELQPIAVKNQKYFQHRSTRYINVGKKQDKKSKSLPELYRDKKDCCGCSACYSICPMSGEGRPTISKRGNDGCLGSKGEYKIKSLTSGYSEAVDIRNHTGAITMLPDEEGFLYPVIDAEICIRCYLCVEVCSFHEN